MEEESNGQNFIFQCWYISICRLILICLPLNFINPSPNCLQNHTLPSITPTHEDFYDNLITKFHKDLSRFLKISYKSVDFLFRWNSLFSASIWDLSTEIQEGSHNLHHFDPGMGLLGFPVIQISMVCQVRMPPESPKV